MADLRPLYIAGDGDVKGPATSSDGELPLFHGSDGKRLKGAGTVVTAQGRALLDDNTPAEQRSTLQLGSAALQNSTAVGNALLTAADQAAQRTALQLGSAALQNSTAVGNALLTAADAAAQRTALQLGTSALVNYTGTGGALMTAADAATARGVLALGSAATRNVMATVGTWGTSDVLVSGAYGMGTQGAVYLPSGSTDCNAHVVGGNWRINTPGNAPPTVAYGLLSVIPGTNICAQQIQRHDASRMWFRGGIDGSWQQWREPVTGRPAPFRPLAGFASNWYGGFNLGTQKQGNLVILTANVVCSGGLANYHGVAVVAHNPVSQVNFVADLLGSNSVIQSSSWGIRTDGLLQHNYPLGVASSPGIPSYPIAWNLQVAYYVPDGGSSND